MRFRSSCGAAHAVQGAQEATPQDCNFRLLSIEACVECGSQVHAEMNGSCGPGGPWALGHTKVPGLDVA